MADRGLESATERIQEIVAGLAEQEVRARELCNALQQAGAPARVVGGAQGVADSIGGWASQVASEFRELSESLDVAHQGRQLGLSIIRAQEEERRRLAREIHDGPAQLLANVVLRIDVCQRLADQDPARMRDELQQLKDLVRVSLQDVRKIIFDLRPMALDDLGLVPALRAYTKEYQARTSIEVELASFGTERRLEPAFEVAIFRLVQEALTNVDKHARASSVFITIETKGTEIRVTIKDNGVGFDVDAARRDGAGSKFGLTGMRERAELIGGHMSLESRPGHGTRVQFAFSVNA